MNLPHPSQLNLADIVLTSRKKSILSNLINIFSTTPSDKTKTIFGHVAIACSSNNKKNIIEALTTGVTKSSITKYSKKHTVLIARLNCLKYFEGLQIINKAESYIGKKYGFLLLIGHLADYFFSNLIRKDFYFFRKLTGNNNYPICSWVVSYAYDSIHIRFNSLKPRCVQPDDIADEIQFNPLQWSVIFSNAINAPTPPKKYSQIPSGPLS